MKEHELRFIFAMLLLLRFGAGNIMMIVRGGKKWIEEEEISKMLPSCGRLVKKLMGLHFSDF